MIPDVVAKACAELGAAADVFVFYSPPAARRLAEPWRRWRRRWRGRRQLLPQDGGL